MKPHKFMLTTPLDIWGRVKAARKNRTISISIHSWIMEAIMYQLKREERQKK